MNSSGGRDYYEDTSLRKYPHNKYYDYQELNKIRRNVFGTNTNHSLNRHSKTIDPSHAIVAQTRKKSKSNNKQISSLKTLQLQPIKKFIP